MIYGMGCLMRLLNTKKMPLTSMGSFIIIVISFMSAHASSMLYNGSYSIFNNWISDLGSSNKNPAGHIYFDIGCIFVGMAIIISTIGLEKWKTPSCKQNNILLFSQFCGLLMALALIMVGIFSEDYGAIHYFWASIFFILFFIFMILTNIALKTHLHYLKFVWYYALITIMINFLFILASTVGVHMPLLEWLAVLSGLIWMGLIGYNTLKLEK
jgi:hypothetical membrane protein